MPSKENVSIFDTISFLRFPLIVLVVFIHANVSESYEINGLTSSIEKFFASYLTAGAVPTFFFISGFLFCRTGLTIDSYKNKLRRRVHSLLIPYLIWSSIAFAILSIKYLPCFSSLFDNLHKNPYDWYLFFMSYIDRPVPEGSVTNHTPLLFPLWYVRDLMILVLITPLLYAFKRYSFAVIAILSIICCYNCAKDNEFPIFSLLFYTMGLHCTPPQLSKESIII